MSSRVTNETNYCIFCGRNATQEHHLLFGTHGRKFADKYGLTIPICDACHTRGEYLCGRIHDNSMAEALSKVAGQLAWEKNYYKDLYNNMNEGADDEARNRFIELYGRSFL